VLKTKSLMKYFEAESQWEIQHDMTHALGLKTTSQKRSFYAMV